MYSNNSTASGEAPGVTGFCPFITVMPLIIKMTISIIEIGGFFPDCLLLFMSVASDEGFSNHCYMQVAQYSHKNKKKEAVPSDTASRDISEADSLKN
jgi:hypothetical protein